MWLKWFPWRYMVRRVARAHGFLDPLTVLTRLERFAQPSEVAAPLELLRAGMVFHARGLMNTAAIQHNLDWVWPYWVERQFDPADVAFIPRAFSITHVNLTHRNWTAIGLPDCDALPVVDPRGLLTPLWDGWSLDGWVVTEDGRHLLPSQAAEARQRWDFGSGLAVVTETSVDGLALESRAEVAIRGDKPICRQTLSASADRPAWLAVALRPYNPEGVSFIHHLALSDDARQWRVNQSDVVDLSEPGDRRQLSDYRGGDVHAHLFAPATITQVTCDVGMATAAALYQIVPGTTRRVVVEAPLNAGGSGKCASEGPGALPAWPSVLERCCRLEVPDAHFQFLYDAALRTLILHSPGDVFPGPYTYKRFWFRDAAFLLHALLCAGLADRVERVLDLFPSRQNRRGYFVSQEGEWDSNGEALWIMHRYCELTGRPPKLAWADSIKRGAKWIARKRLSDRLDAPHAGLLPPGFSAEHLGPNDYYYWDNFWSVAGLQAAGSMLERLGDSRAAAEWRREAQRLLEAIDRSLARTAVERDLPGIPASPYRRMDSGAVGSLVAGYPLQVWEAGEPRLRATADFLLSRCFYGGGFFQDMIHSGINAYLTLHVAQVLLREGDPRGIELLGAVADLASPTGQWPEAIHPRTGGGCMGDGQHAWAAAEWLLAMRNLFVREERDSVVLVAGIVPAWLESGQPLSCGPTLTRFGPVSVRIESQAEADVVSWHASWRRLPARVLVQLPGRPVYEAQAGEASIALARKEH